MNVKQPLDTNLENPKLGAKVGRREAKSILGLVAWGDASTQAAAKDGGIKTIRHADQEHASEERDRGQLDLLGQRQA